MQFLYPSPKNHDFVITVATHRKKLGRRPPLTFNRFKYVRPSVCVVSLVNILLAAKTYISASETLDVLVHRLLLKMGQIDRRTHLSYYVS